MLTVYVVLEEGEAVMVGEETPGNGVLVVHLYSSPPAAVSVTCPPWQMFVLPVTENNGRGSTVIFTESSDAQSLPAADTFTLYNRSTAVTATGFALFTSFRPVVGVH